MCGAPGGSASSALTATATASAEGLERGMLRSGFQQPLLRSRRGSKPVLLQRRDKIALDSGRATVDKEIELPYGRFTHRGGPAQTSWASSYHPAMHSPRCFRYGGTDSTKPFQFRIFDSRAIGA